MNMFYRKRTFRCPGGQPASLTKRIDIWFLMNTFFVVTGFRNSTGGVSGLVYSILLVILLHAAEVVDVFTGYAVSDNRCTGFV